MEALDFNTLITIGVYLLTASGLYWKMRIDLAKIDVEIADIKCDRKEKWSKHDEKQDKSDAYLSDILKVVSNVEAKLSSMETNIEWLKKDNK